MSITKERLQIVAILAEIAAAAGVIVSVIYLAIQIDGSNRELQAQTYNDALANVHAPLMLLVENRELADLVRTGDRDPGELGDNEWFRYKAYQLMRFDGYEFTYYLNRDSSTSHELWVGMDASFAAAIQSSPGIRRFWKEYRHSFADPFRSYVDEKVGRPEP